MLSTNHLDSLAGIHDFGATFELLGSGNNGYSGPLLSTIQLEISAAIIVLLLLTGCAVLS